MSKRYTLAEFILSILKVFVSKSKDVQENTTEPDELEPEVKKPDFTSVSTIIPDKPEPKATWVYLTDMPRTKSRGEAKGVRDWKKITGITLHQTAVQFGNNPMRLLNVPVHGATLPNGDIVILHDPTDYMWHASSLNKSDIGIEVSCRAAGLEGKPESLWLPKKYKGLKGDERMAMEDPATDEQIASTKKLVKYYVNLAKENGGEIKYIHAHRQSSKSRRSDPGERLWREVGEWAKKELGLSDGGPGYVKGGLPLPDEWTDEDNGFRY